jgi:LmeA-like phospholipid-binding
VTVPDSPEPLDTQPIDPIDLPPSRGVRASSEPANPPTKPLPVIVSQKPAKKKRRVWPWIAALVVVILLVVGFFVADNAAKAYARDYIKQRIIAVLHLDPKSPVKVDIGTGSVLLQALAGHLDKVDVTASKVTFGALTGAATIHAENVPLDANAKVGKLDITYKVAEKDVSVLAGNLSGAKLDSVTLDQPEIVASTTFDVIFGITVPVGIGLTPSATTGQIVFTPTSLRVGGETFSAKDLIHQFGSLAENLLKQQSFCVAEFLPRALTVSDVDVVKKELVVKIDGDGAALGGKDISTMGTCQKQM